jgi:DNA-binding response OmpR family regulator
MARVHPLVALADDDPGCLQLLDEVLTDEGYETVCCRHERETFECVVNCRPDLLVLDLCMQRRDSGLCIVEMLRRTRDACRTPVLVCSAHTTALRENADRLRQHDCDLLEKPFDLSDLLARVVTALNPLSPLPATPGL